LLVAQLSRRNDRVSITCDVTDALRYLRGNSADLDRRYRWLVAVQTERDPQTVGELIRFWRTQRRLTQMDLSLDANLSTKHLSFVETGRSGPSRQLLIHLAQHLDLPIAERNRLLLAGGFAPPYLEQPFDGEVMRPLRESLSRLLEAHEPNPALIVDGLWNLIEANQAAALLWDGSTPSCSSPRSTCCAWRSTREASRRSPR
jgi:transcriptional regulator with XRE-family HTH domain